MNMSENDKEKNPKGRFWIYQGTAEKKDPLYGSGFYCSPPCFFYRIVYEQDQKYHIYSGSCGGLSSRLQICGGHDHDVSAETYGRRRLPGDRKT